MRKLSVGIGLALAATLALAACGQPADDKPAASPSTSAEVSATGDSSAPAGASDYKACMVSDSGGFDDKSFNQSGYEGMELAKQQLGVQEATIESNSDADFSPNVASMVQQKCNLIVTVGFLLNDATIEGATANPDVDFAIIDQIPVDKDFAPVVLPNMKPLVFNTQEAAFLAGYLAAGMSQAHSIATFGGMKIPSVTIFMDGYQDGAKKYDEVHGTTTTVLGWDKAAQDGTFVGDFNDQAKGKTFTQNFIDQGADVVMPVAGPVGLGTLAAAQESSGKASVIWVDADGYESNPNYGDVILSSVVKKIGASVYDTIDGAAAGSFDNSNYVGTLANGGIELAPYHDFDSKVPVELKTEIDGLKADIISGKLKVESPSQFATK